MPHLERRDSVLVQQAAEHGQPHGHRVLAVPHKGHALLAQADRVLAAGHAVVLLQILVPHLGWAWAGRRERDRDEASTRCTSLAVATTAEVSTTDVLARGW